MWGAAGTEPAHLVPMPAGRGYRIASQPDQAMVTPELASELRRVLEQFAASSGFTDEQPVGVFFRPGIFGHHTVGRAADIYGVGGAGIDRWKARWDAAVALDAERETNLGWRLYRTMATEGRWSQPYGYPIQLFGPWTRTEGPWKYISDRLLHAHRDHIHVAK